MNRFLGIAGRRDGVATEREARKMMEGHELLLAEAGQKEADLRAELDRRMMVWQIPEHHVKFETRLATVRARFGLDTGRFPILLYQPFTSPCVRWVGGAPFLRIVFCRMLIDASCCPILMPE